MASPRVVAGGLPVPTEESHAKMSTASFPSVTAVGVVRAPDRCPPERRLVRAARSDRDAEPISVRRRWTSPSLGPSVGYVLARRRVVPSTDGSSFLNVGTIPSHRWWRTGNAGRLEWPLVGGPPARNVITVYWPFLTAISNAASGINGQTWGSHMTAPNVGWAAIATTSRPLASSSTARPHSPVSVRRPFASAAPAWPRHDWSSPQNPQRATPRSGSNANRSAPGRPSSVLAA